jgi:outer membrane lipopolysaccharide assembly protein LptE/RlpB
MKFVQNNKILEDSNAENAEETQRKPNPDRLNRHLVFTIFASSLRLSLRSLRLCVEKASLLLLVAALAGCGYHVSGHGDMLPKTVQTIAIPAFGNLTSRYKLARTLPTDIGRELLSRTRYKIVADPSQADAVLTGALHNFAAYPTISANGRSTTVEAVVTLNITLTNRATGAVLFTRAGAEFRERYEISIDPKAYFDESGTAMERLSKSVARSVVSAILEKF